MDHYDDKEGAAMLRYIIWEKIPVQSQLLLHINWIAIFSEGAHFFLWAQPLEFHRYRNRPLVCLSRVANGQKSREQNIIWELM